MESRRLQFPFTLNGIPHRGTNDTTTHGIGECGKNIYNVHRYLSLKLTSLFCTRLWSVRIVIPILERSLPCCKPLSSALSQKLVSI